MQNDTRRNPHAVALGRMGGIRSAQVRMAGATKSMLSRWGSKTVRARWDRQQRMTLRRVGLLAEKSHSDFGASLREFYRELAGEPNRVLVTDSPSPTGNPAHDAYLAAVAETVCGMFDWKLPDWTEERRRFLDEPFFANAPAGMRLYLLQSSPTPFRRRNIFVDRDAVSAAIRKSKMGRRR